MTSTIRIKRRVRLPWKSAGTIDKSDQSDDRKNDINNNETNGSSVTDESSENKLRTSQFSNLSKISVGTPPSYSVFENSAGEMINEKQGVKWPNRPETGYHSVKEYKKRKAFIKKNMAEQERLQKNKNYHDSSDETNETTDRNNGNRSNESSYSKSCITSKKCKEMGFCNMPNVRNSNKEEHEDSYFKPFIKQSYVFCGIRTSDDVRFFVQNYDIYYLFYDYQKSKNEIPFEIPLKVAYYDTKTNDFVVKPVSKSFMEHMVKLPKTNNILSCCN
uniref:Tudor domain-containing protein n=1 Tax=Parastrongyloides trichosuri TaxID=131310 RepID=A0A0N4ZVI2_PARTI